MTVFRRALSPMLLVFCLFALGEQPVSAQESPAQPVLLQQRNEQLHRQLREARREIAQLKAAGSTPGWQDIASGLGIIFGLSGVVMMVNAKRR